jgi:acetyltransferase-like isoleucine patch superfamily enzyme
MHSLKLFIYYILINKLPHSKYGILFNNIRVWYVSSVLKILGSHSKNKYQNNIYIADSRNIKIGEYCQINENVFIQGALIGKYVMIAPNVSILNSTHNFESIDLPMIKQGAIKYNNPVIEDNVWIGRNAVILPGIKIGEGSIVAAGAIVTKDIEPYSIVGGVPAKLLKKRK